MFTLVDADRPDENSTHAMGHSQSMRWSDRKYRWYAVDVSTGAPITVPMTANTTTNVNGTETFTETRLTGIDWTNGKIEATYGNNSTFFWGVGLSIFSDPNRLTPIGQNYFKEMFGQVLACWAHQLRRAWQSAFGALEMSNIDMTSELTN